MKLPARRAAGAREAPGPAAGSVHASPAVPRGGRGWAPLLAGALRGTSASSSLFSTGKMLQYRRHRLHPSTLLPSLGLKKTSELPLLILGTLFVWLLFLLGNNPNGPDAPLPSGVKNVQWDQTPRQPFSLGRFHLYMKWKKPLGGRQARASPSRAVAEALAFPLQISFLCSFISGIGMFLKGSPGWREAETKDRLKLKNKQTNKTEIEKEKLFKYLVQSVWRTIPSPVLATFLFFGHRTGFRNILRVIVAQLVTKLLLFSQGCAFAEGRAV